MNTNAKDAIKILRLFFLSRNTIKSQRQSVLTAGVKMYRGNLQVSSPKQARNRRGKKDITNCQEVVYAEKRIRERSRSAIDSKK